MDSRRGWQDADRHMNLRREMITRIIHLLRERKPNARQDWINKLPEMAKKLEDRLYEYSSSEADYTDETTLTQRLQNIALQITRDRQNQRDQQMMNVQQQHRAPSQVPRSPAMSPYPMPHGAGPSMQGPNQNQGQGGLGQGGPGAGQSYPDQMMRGHLHSQPPPPPPQNRSHVSNLG